MKNTLRFFLLFLMITALLKAQLLSIDVTLSSKNVVISQLNEINDHIVDHCIKNYLYQEHVSDMQSLLDKRTFLIAQLIASRQSH